MNRMRIIGVFGAALLLALTAGAGAWRFLSEKGRVAEAARLETVAVVTAAVDIPLGATINPNQVSVAPWPKAQFPKDAFSTTAGVVGRVALRDFQAGEPVVASKLVPGDRSGGILSLKVPAGMRAFTVKVNEVVGVGGFIVPDARVDVVVTTAPDAQRQQEQVAKTFLQDVRVLAAGQTIEQKDNKPITVNTVTLAVMPEDAEKLALASNDGKIQLVLRNFTDGERVETPGSDKGRLLASLRKAPVRPPAPTTAAPRPVARRKAPAAPPAAPMSVSPPVQAIAPPPVARAESTRDAVVVEVIRGGKRSEESFP